MRYAPLTKTHARRQRQVARWHGKLRGVEDETEAQIYFYGEHHMMLKQAGYQPEHVTEDEPAYVRLNKERTEITGVLHKGDFITEQQARAQGLREAYGV